ncbi:MAG: 30S ribosomal protein S4 [Bryobacterales bacterium]|nr:30S ribosomal protein S4 [Bryobacterales bacterium]
MARYRGPVCRLCRRESTKLFLKGERCYTEKCAIEKRNFVPGQHGRERRGKVSNYGLQLREKQKMRRIYGLLEVQLRNLYEKSSKAKGVTGSMMLAFMERRLDSIIYRLGIASSRPQARQIVRHGHIAVNGKRVNIPSYVVKPGDEVAVHEKSTKHPMILSNLEVTSSRPLVSWLDFDRDALKGKVASEPKREELVQIQLNEQLVVELYSK